MRKPWISLFSKLLGTASYLAIVVPSGPVAAESRILLPYPDVFGAIPASTYNLEGQRIGNARLSLSLTADQTVRVEVFTGVQEGARTSAHAELSQVESGSEGKLLRLLREQSESHDESGRSLGILRIDHEKGEATCSPPEGEDAKTIRFELPDAHRITNVPLNLLFLPLVQGLVKQIDFQLFLCRGGPRVLEFAATIAEPKRPAQGQDLRIVEVQYRPDLGRVLSWLASGFTPNLSFWFDASGGGSYLAHRMPLFSRGPEVLIVRDGLPPGVLHRLN